MIKSAAIMKDGILWMGKRHDLIIAAIVEATGKKVGSRGQGFVTDDGRFVSREEAKRIAVACNQIKRKRSGDKLYSEDLK